MNLLYELLLQYIRTEDLFKMDSQIIGSIGEDRTVGKLKQISSDELYGIPLKNVYLPVGDGRTSEVDVLFVTQKGLFVIESKNYAGWIFGTENNKTLTVGYKGGRKEHFYNPVMQNRSHIKYLEKFLGKNIPIFSLIVFSDRCELMKVDITTSSIKVIHRKDLIKTITKICTEYPDVFNKQLVSYISQQLYPLTIVDEGIKKKHINDIKDRCPVCGRALVERTAKTGPNAGGKFMGCSGFPNCRYTRKI